MAIPNVARRWGFFWLYRESSIFLSIRVAMLLMVKKIVIFGMTTISQFMDNGLRDVFFQLVRIGLWNKGLLY